MLCQHCQKNEATTHIKRNINGCKEEMHLCSECAEKLGVLDDFKMPTFSEMFNDSFIGNFLGAGIPSMNSLVGVERCDTCGSTFNDIVKSGRVGCSDCYNKFSDKLEPSINKIHGNSKHLGKFVEYQEFKEKNRNKEKSKDNRNKEFNVEKSSDIFELNNQLKLAIDEQRFEDAAKIRDRINFLKENNNE